MMDMSTWINFNAYTSLGMNFNPQHDKKRAFEVASQIFSASSPDKASLRENDEFWNELLCVL